MIIISTFSKIVIVLSSQKNVNFLSLEINIASNFENIRQFSEPENPVFISEFRLQVDKHMSENF